MKFTLFLILVFLSACSLTNNPQPKSSNEILLTRGLSLHDAIRLQDRDVIEHLSSNKKLINTKDKSGYTPLHLAVRLNDITTIQQLIDEGANINSIDQYGDTPLIDSTRNNLTPISEALVCNGANINVFDDQKKTPLNYALLNKNQYIATLLKNHQNLENYCKHKIELTLNFPTTFTVAKPNICGTINQALNNSIEVILQDNKQNIYGPYIKRLKNGERSWCLQIPDSLTSGDYQTTVIAKIANRELSKQQKFTITLPQQKESQLSMLIEDSVNDLEDFIELEESNSQDSNVTTSSTKDILLNDDDQNIVTTLYNLLYTEFKEDLEQWNAQLNPDTLVLRFKSPHLIFQHGKSGISNKYQKVLNDFFPRYVKILQEYDVYIDQVFIEGHTSSQYRTAKTSKEKFQYNMKLSQKRAQAVVNYLKNINDVIISENRQWINETFKPIGRSSSQLIMKEDGTEDSLLSRRVEFKINLSTSGLAE